MEIEQQTQTKEGRPTQGSGGPGQAPEAAEAADAEGAEGAAGSACPAASKGRALPAFLRELARGLLLSIGRPDLDRVGPAPAVLVLVACADLIFNLLASYLLVGPQGYFSHAALTSFFFHLPLLLLFGLVAARLLSRPCLVHGIPAALVALSIPVELCHAAVEWLAQWRPFEWLERYLAAPHYYRFFWWWAAAALLFLFRLDSRGGWRRLRLPGTFALIVLVPLWHYPRGDLWMSPAAVNESGELSLTGEVIAAQDRLLDAELAGLAPGRRGKVDLYFVGFAGDASQDVFLKELTFARRLFDERFGTERRSVLLANNPLTATTLPFATVENLGRTLARIGKAMNPEEDVLFLYLSSHGSKEHELEVQNPPLELRGVTPKRLKGLLEESGIRWKVVVVSACFSGGFIEPLQGEGTLVITAADPRHESFGCGFGEEFTWFGHAYLGEALAEERSFVRAFEKAREIIAKWEEERGETPSNPQIRAGEGILEKLESLEK